MSPRRSQKVGQPKRHGLTTDPESVGDGCKHVLVIKVEGHRLVGFQHLDLRHQQRRSESIGLNLHLVIAGQREASIEDQIRNARVIVDRAGLSEPVIYSDSAISGTRSDRPDYNRLMDDIERRDHNSCGR